MAVHATTILQKNLADKIIELAKSPKKINRTQLVMSAGYSQKFAQKHQKQILEQKGLLQELEVRGFSIIEADKTISKLLRTSRSEKIKINAAQEIYKRLGAYAPEKRMNLNRNVADLSEEDRDELKDMLLASFATLQQSGYIPTLDVPNEPTT